MRPRLISRGNIAAVGDTAQIIEASMRPRLISRGNNYLVTQITMVKELQ